MAYDTKRLKTFKWLEGLAKDSRFGIVIRSGHIYATDNIVLVRVDYPEFSDLSLRTWSRIKAYFNEDGKLLEVPELESDFAGMENASADFFDRHFIDYATDATVLFDYACMRKVLKPFEINRIKPCIFLAEDKIGLTGRNKEVAIEIVLMGCKR